MKCCALVRGLSLLTSPLGAVVLGNLCKSLFAFGLTFGGCTGSSPQEMGTKRGLMRVLCSSMAVEGSLLWVFVEDSFYAAGRSGLKRGKDRTSCSNASIYVAKPLKLGNGSWVIDIT